MGGYSMYSCDQNEPHILMFVWGLFKKLRLISTKKVHKWWNHKKLYLLHDGIVTKNMTKKGDATTTNRFYCRQIRMKSLIALMMQKLYIVPYDVAKF